MRSEFAPVLEETLSLRDGTMMLNCSAQVTVEAIHREDVRLRIDGYYFTATALRQLAEFCQLAADVLDRN